jgi:hypothetical protein
MYISAFRKEGAQDFLSLGFWLFVHQKVCMYDLGLKKIKTFNLLLISVCFRQRFVLAHAEYVQIFCVAGQK